MRDVQLGSSEDTFRHLRLLMVVESTGISKLYKFLYVRGKEGVIFLKSFSLLFTKN